MHGDKISDISTGKPRPEGRGLLTGMKYVYGYKGEFFISNATSKHVRSAIKMLGLKDGESIIPPGGLRRSIAYGEIREKIRDRSRPDMYR